MKKRTKILLAILSAAAISAGTFALAGCGSKSKQVYNETYYAEYQAYVDAKKKAKEDYLGYEEWLTLKLFEDANGGGNGADGTNGTNGKDGAAWLTGTTAPAATDGKDGDFYLNTTNFTIYSKSNGVWTELGSIMGADGVGEDGVGIDSVEYKDGKIVIHLTNGETKEVELPAQVTHVHAYDDENVVTLIEPTADSDGLGYKVCTDPDCDHLELVILSMRYIVTVSDMAGDPIEGATVTINGAKAVTDKNGIAVVTGYGYKNDYIVLVEKSGYEVAGTVRARNNNAISVTMIDVLDETTYKNDTYPAIKKAGVYNIAVTSQNVGSSSLPELSIDRTMIILCNETDEYKNYSFTFGDIGAKLQDESWDDLPNNVVVAPHKQIAVNFWYDSQKFEQNEYNIGDTVTYVVTVEETPVPDIGTETMRWEVEGDTEITLPEGKTDWVYYTWENTNGDFRKINFSMTNVEIEFTTRTGMTYSMSDSDTPTVVQDGVSFDIAIDEYGWGLEPFAYIGVYKFRARLIDGASEGKFTLHEVADPGTLTNPFEITLNETDGKVTTDHNEAEEVWFKVDIPEKEKYTIIRTNCQGVEIYDHKPDPDNWMDFPQYSVNGTADVFELETGTYYVKVTAPYGPALEVVFRKFAASTDAGLSAIAPIEITDFESKLTDNSYEIEKSLTVPAETDFYEEDTYYSFVAPKAGTVSVSHADEENLTYSIYVGNLDTTDFYLDSLDVEEGEVVIVRIHVEGNGGNTIAETFTITWTPDKTVGPEGPDYNDPANKPTKENEEVHTFTVKDADDTPLAGVTVTLTAKYVDESDGEVKEKEFTGTTESDGTVTLTFLPGVYAVTVGGAYESNDEYRLSGTVTTRATGSQSYTITYAVKKDLTIKVVDSNGDEVSGVTVKIAAADFEASTSTDGTVTLHYFPGTYAIVLEDYDEEEYLYTSVSTSSNSWNDAAELEVTLRNDYYTYNITVMGGATPLEGVAVTLSAGSSVIYGADATTDVTGKIAVKVFYVGTATTLKYDVVLTAEQQELYGFAYEVTKEIIKSNTPGEESVTINLVEKVAYNITVLNTSGGAVGAGITVTFKYGNDTVGTATTNGNGVATAKLVNVKPGEEDPYDLVALTVELDDLPAGTNAPEITLAAGTTTATVKLGVGDKAVAGATGNSYTELFGDTDYGMVVGINALTNSDRLNYYTFSASSGTYTFKITDKSTTSYISYLRVGDNDVLINGGQQNLVKYGVILGANRGINEAYEVTLTFTGSAEVVIGYETGTDEGGEGQITIARVTTEPETPSTPSTPSAQTLTSGENPVTLTDGEATATYAVSQTYSGYLKLTWDDDDIEVKIDGEPVESGVEFRFGGMEVEIVITSKSGSTASVTLTVEEVQPNGD